MQPKHLTKAPISEALVDLRVQSAADVDPASFKMLGGALGSGYGAPIEQVSFSSQISFPPGAAPKATKDESLVGYMYRSNDQKLVAQFRRDGFTLSRLHPYTTWKLVFEEAQRLWRIYVEAARPQKVVRSALRYINRLDLPVDGSAYDAYLLVPPRLPEGIGNRLSSFLSRLIVEGVSGDLTAIITQAVEPGPEVNKPSVLLDIDVFTERQLDPLSPTVVEVLQRIHDAKNLIFFNCITEKTAELYQ